MNVDNLGTCLKRGNHLVNQEYLTYTLKDLKSLSKDLGLKLPTKSHKSDYCQAISNYKEANPDASVHLYKWQVGQYGDLEEQLKIKTQELLELANSFGELKTYLANVES